MKKYYLKYSYLLVAVSVFIVFIGCSKDISYIVDTLLKDKTIVMSLDEILADDSVENNIQKDLLYNSHTNYDKNYTQQDLEKNHLLVFYFTLNNRNPNKVYGNALSSVILKPCSSTEIYSFDSDYPGFFKFHGKYSESLPKNYAVYFNINYLKKIGYISLNFQQQQDLCIYEKTTSGGMGKKDYFSSNKLVYTAEEINNALAEYEALQ